VIYKQRNLLAARSPQQKNRSLSYYLTSHQLWIIHTSSKKDNNGNNHPVGHRFLLFKLLSRTEAVTSWVQALLFSNFTFMSIRLTCGGWALANPIAVGVGCGARLWESDSIVLDVPHRGHAFGRCVLPWYEAAESSEESKVRRSVSRLCLRRLRAKTPVSNLRPVTQWASTSLIYKLTAGPNYMIMFGERGSFELRGDAGSALLCREGPVHPHVCTGPT